jgi:hypothetical protein
MEGQGRIEEEGVANKDVESHLLIGSGIGKRKGRAFGGGVELGIKIYYAITVMREWD